MMPSRGPGAHGLLPGDGKDHLPDMVRRRAAAAAQDRGARFQQGQHISAELLRAHIVYGLSFPVQGRKPRVGLRNERHRGHLRHLPDHRRHLVRSGGTVRADSVRAQAGKDQRGGRGVGAEQTPAVRLEGHGHHDGQLRTGLLGGDQRRSGLLQAHHGLHHEQIRTGLCQTADLLFINVDQFFKIHSADGGQLLAGHRQVPRHQRPVSHGPAGDLHQRTVQLPNAVLQAELLQLDPVGGKGRGVDDLRPRVRVFSLETLQHLRMLRDPELRAHARRHPALLEIGACGAVQKDGPVPDKLFKLFLCHKLPLPAACAYPARLAAFFILAYSLKKRKQ